MLRRACQIGVVIFIAWGAANVAWRNFKVAHNSARLVGLMQGEVWATLYALDERALSLWGEPYQTSVDFLGLPWAARLGGVATADPILVAAHALRTGAFDLDLLLMAAAPLLIALLLGKVFCSHLCPARLLFEVGQWIRGGLLYLGIPLLQARLPARLGGWVLLGGALATLGASTAVWLLLLPYVGFGAGLFLWITAGPVAGLLIALGALLAFDVLVAPGQFCHALCPQGWLLEQVGRRARLRLHKEARAADCPAGCRACVRACPYALSPKDLTHLPACDNCGQCVPACPEARLLRSLRPPRAGGAAPAIPAPAKAARRALPGLLALTALAVAALAPATGHAHHNKGLPHYGYFENYPQVPTEENVVIAGRWEFGATIFNFQGLDRASADTPNDVKFYVYLYDLERDVAYAGPLRLDVRLDGQTITRFVRERPDQETTYMSRETLPEGGDYDLVAIIEQDGERIEVALPFTIELADEIRWGLIIGLTAPVVLLFGLALLGRTPRGRARLQRLRGASSGAGLLALLLARPAGAQGVGAPSPAPSADLANCADPDSVARTLIDAHGNVVMVMEGMPPLVFVLGMGLVILLSFLLLERLGARPPSTWRLNLIRDRRVYRLVRSRWFQAVPQILMVVLLAGLIYAGLFGHRARNITPVAVWTIWWAGLIVAVALAGPIFCFACPWDGLANLLSRLRLAARVPTLSLRLPVPPWLKTLYPAILLFALLSWAELGLDTTRDPRQTAYLGLAMAVLAVAGALMFDEKVMCRFVCPVGRISGLYANFSPVEVRPRNPRACLSCTTQDCLNGNARGYPCPTGILLPATQDATYCTLCTECVKSCDRHNVAFNLRPFGADLDRPASAAPRRDEAWLALSLLALTLFHGLSMTTAWEHPLPGRPSIMRSIAAFAGTGEVLSFTLGMAAVTLLPIALYAGSSHLAARLTRGSGVGARRIFTHYALALLPLALFYHLAHNAMHLLTEGGAVLPLLSDPLGRGHDLFGTATVRVGHLLSDGALWAVQLALVLVGHLFALLVAHRISRRLFSERRHATLSLVPMTLVMVLVSGAGLVLMALDMSMTTGRI